MDRALEILQKFAIDVRNGKVSDDKLRFGAPWRHPPKVDDPKLCMEWAKLQLMDFVKSLINAEFGVNVLIFFQFIIFPCGQQFYWKKEATGARKNMICKQN